MKHIKPFNTPRWPEVSPLLDEWLDLPEAERPSWLTQLRARDAELARELETLLAGTDHAGRARMLDGSAALPAGDEGLAGRTIGAYVLESPLGQGGSGSVWRAKRQDGRYDGTVAIKLLHLHMLGRAAATRFQREGQILAQLQHPHIAQMLDAGVTTDGQPYLVLELVEGEPIDRYCDALRLGLNERLALFDDVLSAVANAHAHGVIHRDLKPANILVNREGQAKLLDFGIAKLHDDQAGASDATELTRNEGGPMTPAYAAPEQLLGQPLTTATDVYSLGVLLYQLLTGHHPAGARSSDAHALARATLELDAPRLSQVVDLNFSGLPEQTSPQSLKRVQHWLAGDLETIVGHALAKKPAERYPGVPALAEDLRRWRNHEPISAQPPSLAYRTRKFIRRNRGAVAAGALTTLAILAGVIGTVSQAHRAEQEATRAREEARNAQRELTRSDAVVSVLNAALGTAAEKPQTMAQLVEAAEVNASAQFANNAAALGYIKLTLASLWDQAGNKPRVQALAEQAEALARQAGNISDAASAACFKASALLSLNKKAEAKVKLDQALIDAKTLSPHDNLSLLGCYDMRSGLAGDAGDIDTMRTVVEAALQKIKDSGVTNVETLMLGNSLKTRLLLHQDRVAEALQSYEQTLAGLKALGQDDSTLRSAFFNNFGLVLMAAGQMQGAETLLRRTTEVIKQSGGEMQDAMLANRFGLALKGLGRWSEAAAQLGLARDIHSAQQATQQMVIDARYLADVACEQGDLARCEAELQQAAAQPGVALSLVQARRDLLGQRPQQARATLLSLHDKLLKPSTVTHRQFIRQQGLTLLSQAELENGNPPAALKYAQEALVFARAESQGLPGSTWTGQALMSQARAQWALGDKAAAQASQREAVAQFSAAAGASAPVTEQARAALPK